MPDFLQDMELYSTVLWQLRKEIDISYLAQTAIGLDRLDPRSWCIMGNCFSLQKVIIFLCLDYYFLFNRRESYFLHLLNPC